MKLDEQQAKDLDFILLQMSKTTKLLTIKLIKKNFLQLEMKNHLSDELKASGALESLEQLPDSC